METLVKETLPNLLPPVVPEFPAITIGGALAGTGAESSSFRNGFLADTISWIKMILATGEVIGASGESNEDLFYGCAGSLVTLLKIQLLEAMPFVELTYHLVRGIDDAAATTRKACGDALNDFVDGIVFSKSRGAVVTARFVDLHQPNTPVQSFLQPRDEWFYLHVEHIMNRETLNAQHGVYEKPQKVKEIVQVQDYLFRYDRGASWAGRHIFTYYALPFVYILRWLFDPVLRTKVMYHGLNESGLANYNLI